MDDMCYSQPVNLLGDRGLSRWYMRRGYGSRELWHSYLVRRVQKETNSDIRRFCDIREVAECVNRETGADLATTIGVLCWPALKYATDPRSESELRKVTRNTELDLLCAAACLNLLPLAKRLLRDGIRPTDKSFLFSSPIRLAAWFGDAEMLQVFQARTPDRIDLGPWQPNWTGKAGPDSIQGAVIRGDLDMVRLAIYPPSRTMPNDTHYYGEPFGHVDRHGDSGYALHNAQCYTRSPEVHKYLESFFSTTGKLEYELALHCRLGNLEMVQYLLDAGADTRGICSRYGNPLAEACRNCHQDIVEILLERGADANYGGEGPNGRNQGANVLASAAAGGCITIVRKLLDHGVDISGTRLYEPLRRAIRIEHTGIVRLFLGLVPDLRYGRGGYSYLLKFAAKQGLDSMVELLEQEVQ